MPLVRSWWLGKKKGKEAYVVPHVQNGRVEFSIGHDPAQAPTKDNDGTVTRNGAICVACGSAVPLTHIRAEGKAKRIRAQLMAIAVEGHRRRVYLAPTSDHEQAADVPIPDDVPETELSTHPQYMGTPRYGMTRHADLFTPRQLIALTTFSGLVKEVREKVFGDGIAAGLPRGGPLHDGGTGATARAEAVVVYLAATFSKIADMCNQLVSWKPSMDQAINLFKRQAIPMLWDYAETPILSDKHAGGYTVALRNLAKAIPCGSKVGQARQGDARSCDYRGFVVSTDPPYYDNVPYSDLADFFYIWLRRSLSTVYPSIMGTVLTPKTEELVADKYRLGGKEEAGAYFENGFVNVFARIRVDSPRDMPITVFYAFKQVETDDGGTASTGWEVLLEGMIRSGWEVTATWPIRTELGNRTRSLNSNALASSVVLACRPRPEGAPAVTRRAFLAALTEQLPSALKELQQGSIAPADLAQAAIGPGMAIFSQYAKVVEPDGSDMPVRMALALINQALDEVLSEQEGDFDSDTRFCVKWFAQFGWDEGETGTADTLSRATNTSVGGLERGGIFSAKAGKARLLRPDELSPGWDPAADDRVSVWEVVVRLAQELQAGGIKAAARLMAQAGQRVDLDTAKELAYLLFSICEKRRDTKSALLFNSLGTSWSDLSAAARTGGTLTPPPAPDQLDFDSL
jgi:putative DNA methylase